MITLTGSILALAIFAYFLGWVFAVREYGHQEEAPEEWDSAP